MSEEQEQNERIDALVRRYREIGATVEELRAEQAEIKLAVDALVTVGWKGSIDGQPVHKRNPNRSFCPITAVGLLAPEQLNNCKVIRYDEKMLRAAVDSLGKLEDCMLLKADALPVLKL